MIRIYTFTYAGDAQEAVACVRCARTALPEAVVTVVDDSAAPVPPEASCSVWGAVSPELFPPLRQPARPGVRPGNHCHAGQGGGGWRYRRQD